MKKQAAIVIGVVILVFLLTITVYQHVHDQSIRRKLHSYGQLMAYDMWQLDQADLQRRLEELVKVQNYDEARLLHADTKEFLRVPNTQLQPGAAERFGLQFGLLRRRSYHTPIEYHGRTLGYLTVTARTDSLAAQLYLAVLLALTGLAVIYHCKERCQQQSLLRANTRLLREVDERKRITRALQESEERHISLLQNLPIGVFLVSADFRMLTMNHQMQQWHPKMDLAKQPKCYQCLHGPDTDSPCDDCPAQKTLADGEPHEAVITADRHDSTRKLRVMAAPVRNDLKEIIAATVMVDDITERLALEERLRKAKRLQAELDVARFKEILDNTTELVAVINPNRQIRYLNRAGCRLLGIDPTQPLPNLHAAQLHEPEIAADVQERAFAIARKKGVWSGESLFRRHDGSAIPMLQVMIAHRGSDGELEYFSTIGTDISAIRQASRALQFSEERLRAIFQNATVGIVLVNAAGQYVDFNLTWQRMIGYPKNELRRIGPLEVTLPDDHESGVDTIRGAMIAGESYRAEKRYVRKDGSVFWAELSTSLIDSKDPDEQLLLGVIADINERKEAETRTRTMNEELELRVRERTAELETFCYSVSHDLRTPLRGINGFSHALQADYETQLDETALDYLSRIRRAANRMSTLIDGLLNLSRLSRREIQLESVDLAEDAEEIVAELRRHDAKRQVAVKIQTGVSCVQGDSRLLYNALQNLLANAWKFTRDTVDAQICFGCRQQEGTPVYFVKDNGVGFDMSYENKLFIPFQRLHGRDEFEGSGVGLASVHRIVCRHGGRIWAESSPGQGATFFFTLQPEIVVERIAACEESD